MLIDIRFSRQKYARLISDGTVIQPISKAESNTWVMDKSHLISNDKVNTAVLESIINNIIEHQNNEENAEKKN